MFTPPKRPVPVFPLPDLVMFPDAELPLHVFELRYRTMVREALSGERWIAMATLKPGWEADYHGSPAFHPLGCLARFEDVEWLPNDCYDLRLRGVRRVQFVRTIREFPYRACVVEVLGDAPFDAEDPPVQIERAALLDLARKLLPLGTTAWLAPPRTGDDDSFVVVVNSLAQCARLETSAKLELLAIESVVDRARRLQEHLKRLGSAPAGPNPGSGRN
jgi:Lon protease-like protein